MSGDTANVTLFLRPQVTLLLGVTLAMSPSIAVTIYIMFKLSSEQEYIKTKNYLYDIKYKRVQQSTIEYKANIN